MSDLVKSGDTVICVEDRQNLTLGKLYLVEGTRNENSGYFYLVTGDNGVPNCKYYARRFKLHQSVMLEAAEEYDDAMLAQSIMDDLNG